MSTVTIDDVMSWNPCDEYDRARVTRLFRGRGRLGALDILRLSIPAEDKLWAVLREELIHAPVLHEFACQFAERALDRVERDGGVADPCSRAAIETKRRWLRGEASDEELSAARNAAREAAWSAAREAAWSAAWSARNAAREAAWQTAWNAAREARNAERRAQLNIVRRWAKAQTPEEGGGAMKRKKPATCPMVRWVELMCTPRLVQGVSVPWSGNEPTPETEPHALIVAKGELSAANERIAALERELGIAQEALRLRCADTPYNGDPVADYAERTAAEYIKRAEAEMEEGEL